MTLVDSSVWVDYFRGVVTPQTNALDDLLAKGEARIGDLMLVEVLQGYRTEPDAGTAMRLFDQVPCMEIGGRACALAAADHYRRLRALAITPRKTIDTLIATRCILDGIELLHSDRDFEPFVRHLGLRSALP